MLKARTFKYTSSAKVHTYWKCIRILEFIFITYTYIFIALFQRSFFVSKIVSTIAQLAADPSSVPRALKFATNNINKYLHVYRQAPVLFPILLSVLIRERFLNRRQIANGKEINFLFFVCYIAIVLFQWKMVGKYQQRKKYLLLDLIIAVFDNNNN